jgi:hypothetical protein
MSLVAGSKVGGVGGGARKEPLRASCPPAVPPPLPAVAELALVRNCDVDGSAPGDTAATEAGRVAVTGPPPPLLLPHPKALLSDPSTPLAVADPRPLYPPAPLYPPVPLGG